MRLAFTRWIAMTLPVLAATGVVAADMRAIPPAPPSEVAQPTAACLFGCAPAEPPPASDEQAAAASENAVSVNEEPVQSVRPNAKSRAFAQHLRPAREGRSITTARRIARPVAARQPTIKAAVARQTTPAGDLGIGAMPAGWRTIAQPAKAAQNPAKAESPYGRLGQP